MGYLKLFLAIFSIISLTHSQTEQSERTWLFGAAYDTGIPYRDFGSYGYSIHGEYSFNTSFSVLFEYSTLQYSGNDEDTPSINVDVNISAPAFFVCWKTPAGNPLQFFIGIGAGYTLFQGTLRSGSSFMFFGTDPRYLILPQAKLGLHYFIDDHFGLNCHLNFYRLLSIGVDYSL